MFAAIYLTTVASLLCGGAVGFSFGDGLKKASNDGKSDDDFGLVSQKLGQNDKYSYGGYKSIDSETRCKKDKEIAKLVYDEAVRLCNKTEIKSGLTSLSKCKSAKTRAQELSQKASDSCIWWQWKKPLLKDPSDYLDFIKYKEGLKDGSIQNKVDLPPGWKSGSDGRPWWVDHFRNSKKQSTGMKLWYGLDRLYPERYRNRNRNRDSRGSLTDYMPEKMHLDFVNWRLKQEEQAKIKRLDNQQSLSSQDTADAPISKRGDSILSDLLQQKK